MATGVQLNPGVHLAYFQPTVDQYLKKIEQAITSGDLASAQQALAQLKKAAASTGQAGDAKGGTARQGANLNDVSAALGSGDLAWAERAVSDLRQALSSGKASSGKTRATDGERGADGASSSEAQGDSSETNGPADGGRGLDVKA